MLVLPSGWLDKAGHRDSNRRRSVLAWRHASCSLGRPDAQYQLVGPLNPSGNRHSFTASNGSMAASALEWWAGTFPPLPPPLPSLKVRNTMDVAISGTAVAETPEPSLLRQTAGVAAFPNKTPCPWRCASVPPGVRIWCLRAVRPHTDGPPDRGVERNDGVEALGHVVLHLQFDLEFLVRGSRRRLGRHAKRPASSEHGTKPASPSGPPNSPPPPSASRRRRNRPSRRQTAKPLAGRPGAPAIAPSPPATEAPSATPRLDSLLNVR